VAEAPTMPLGNGGRGSAAGPRRPRVLGVCIGPARRAAVVRMLGEVVASGGSALLVTADGAVAADLPDGVEALDLVAEERQVGVHRVISRSPVRLARRLAGRPAVPGPSLAWRAWSRSRPYRAIRPWVQWRALRRRLDVVDLDSSDHLVIVSVDSWPITWQLCRLRAELSYGWDVPDELYQRVGLTPPVRD